MNNAAFDPDTRKPRSKSRHEVVADKPRKAGDRFAWEKAFRAAPLPHVVKAIGFAAATYGGGDGRQVRPGVANLADDFRLDEKTIRRHLETLEVTGWLVLVAKVRRVRDTWHATEYHLAIPVSHDHWTDLSSGDDRTNLSGDDAPQEPTTGQFTNDHRTNLSASPDKFVRTPCSSPSNKHQVQPPPPSPSTAHAGNDPAKQEEEGRKRDHSKNDDNHNPDVLADAEKVIAGLWANQAATRRQYEGLLRRLCEVLAAGKLTADDLAKHLTISAGDRWRIRDAWQVHLAKLRDTELPMPGVGNVVPFDTARRAATGTDGPRDYRLQDL